jgi:predicted nucleic acid-binding protein
MLNRFRQDHGYKEGSYIKIWKNREDNVVMQEILEENQSITPEMLYQKLEEAYPA